MVQTQRVKNSSATPYRKERKAANHTCLRKVLKLISSIL